MVGVLAVSIAVFLVALVVIGRAAIVAFRQLVRIHEANQGTLQGILEGGAASQEARFRDLEDLVDRLPNRWEEIKREASRLDGRARYAVSRVREELASLDAEDDAVTELAAELELPDVEGGGTEGVLPMRPGVAEAPQPDNWRAHARARLNA